MFSKPTRLLPVKNHCCILDLQPQKKDFHLLLISFVQLDTQDPPLQNYLGIPLLIRAQKRLQLIHHSHTEYLRMPFVHDASGIMIDCMADGCTFGMFMMGRVPRRPSGQRVTPP